MSTKNQKKTDAAPVVEPVATNEQDPTALAPKPEGPSAEELRDQWHAAKMAEVDAERTAEVQRSKRKSIENELGRRLAEKAKETKVKSAVLVMPDGIEYKAIFKEGTYSLVRAGEKQRLTL